MLSYKADRILMLKSMEEAVTNLDSAKQAIEESHPYGPLFGAELESAQRLTDKANEALKNAIAWKAEVDKRK